MRSDLVTTRLPIDDVLPQLLAGLAQHGTVALRAPTGAGKTTRVPPAIAAGTGGRVLVLEPRRVAARAAASRMAYEAGTSLGREVGYHVRFDRKASANTQILVVTDGMFLQYLQDDPFLDGVAAVVIDEFHERSMQVDLALGMVERVRRDVRDDLQLVVMSATLDIAGVAEYLGDCAVVESEGRTYPVETVYVGGFDSWKIAEATSSAVRRAWREDAGSVLAFLPGVGEIRRTAHALEEWGGDAIPILQLYGDLPPAQQDAVLAGRHRRIVLATNVAETSVTVPGVTTVVDTGLAKVLKYDTGRELNRLVPVPISQASADQRAGRAGRERPGRCLRLWKESEHRLRPAFDVPEIQRVALAGPALTLLAWGEPDLTQFPWFEPPPDAALEKALDLLRLLGALSSSGITELGRRMSRIGAEPRLARLVVAGQELGCVREAALAAAVMAERDPWARQEARHTSPSDVADRIEAASRGDRRFRIIQRVADKLARGAKGPTARPGDQALDRALLAAFPDRVCRRRIQGQPRAVSSEGRGVALSENSAVHDAEFFLALQLDAGRRGTHADALVRIAHALDPALLPTRTITAAVFDRERERVIGETQVRYRDLVLSAQQGRRPAPEDAAQLLAEIVAPQLDRFVPMDRPPLSSWLARVQIVAKHLPDLELPPLDAPSINERLPELCHGAYSLADLRARNWPKALSESLTWAARQAIDTHAPERLQVPSGKQLRVVYEPGSAPVLAARIQDMFGSMQTPTIARGRVPVVLHLLAPNMRPAAVTQDLPNFWENVYPEVRKELRGRYPKHHWPEDPKTAAPQRHPKRRKK